jgi:hypothetical protein
MSCFSLRFALVLLIAAAGCSDNGTKNGTTPTPPDATDAAGDSANPTDVDSDTADSANATEVGSDAAGGERDSVSDAPGPMDSSADDADAEADGASDARDTADADAHADADASADAADANDDHSDGDVADVPRDVRVDALVCPMFTVVAYNQPGCGANAPPPYCQGSTDACLGPVCGCDGVTTATGCGFSTAPFSAWGPCPDGGGRDGAAD